MPFTDDEKKEIRILAIKETHKVINTILEAAEKQTLSPVAAAATQIRKQITHTLISNLRKLESELIANPDQAEVNRSVIGEDARLASY